MARRIEVVLGDLLTRQKKTLAIAESCTGGLTANLITNVSGSSVYFIGGVIAYSNRVKIDLLKVPEHVINTEGAVSKACAVAMAQNIRSLLRADLGVGITGIAGPGNTLTQKPVGLVYIAVTDGRNTMCKLFNFEGNRLDVKQKAGEAALGMVKELIQPSKI